MILSKWFLSWTCKGSISCEGMLIIPIVYIDNAYQCVHSMDRIMHDADRSTHFMCIHFTFHKIPIQFIVKEIKLHVIDDCINLEVRFEFVLYYYEYMKYWSKSDIHTCIWYNQIYTMHNFKWRTIFCSASLVNRINSDSYMHIFTFTKYFPSIL